MKSLDGRFNGIKVVFMVQKLHGREFWERYFLQISLDAAAFLTCFGSAGGRSLRVRVRPLS